MKFDWARALVAPVIPGILIGCAGLTLSAMQGFDAPWKWGVAGFMFGYALGLITVAFCEIEERIKPQEIKS